MAKNSFSDSTQCSVTAIQRQPTRMLKDFLYDDDSSSKLCSSSDRNPPPAPLQRSRSRSRAAVLSFQKLLSSAVKSLHRISPSPSPSLQRSLSKRILTKFRRSEKSTGSGDGKGVKVKDILRWRSFRDEEIKENKSPLSDSPETTASGEESRCEGSDFSFTAEELPRFQKEKENKSPPSDSPETTASSEESRCEESDFSFTAEELTRRSGGGKKWTDEDEVDGDVDGDVAVDVDPVWETKGAMDVPEMGHGHQEDEEDDLEFEEDKEQHSPVSVLNSPFRDEISDEEAASSFDQSLANVERTKQRLLQSIQWLETLAGVDEHSSQDDDLDTEDEDKDKVKGKDIKEDIEEVTREKENSVVAKSRDYMFKVLSRLRTKAQGVDSKDCIKEMDRELQWAKFGEERQEVGFELEGCLLQDLVDEVLVDVFG